MHMGKSLLAYELSYWPSDIITETYELFLKCETPADALVTIYLFCLALAVAVAIIHNTYVAAGIYEPFFQVSDLIVSDLFLFQRST